MEPLTAGSCKLEESVLANYLITGVAGFIGPHLAQAVLAQGHRVRGVDNLSTGLRGNVPEGVEFVETDLRDAEATAAACLGMDVILHQAALPSVPRSVANPRPSHESNIDGTFNLLERARAAWLRRVVYAASSSAFGADGLRSVVDHAAVFAFEPTHGATFLDARTMI